MQALHQKAKDLLESGRVKVIIGYGEGSGEKVRPVFIRHSADVSQLVWDQRCRQNLAVYLSKPEIKKMGMPAIVATPVVVRSVVQLIAEQQITSSDLVTLVIEDTAVMELTDNPLLEKYVVSHPVVFPPHVNKEIDTLARDVGRRAIYVLAGRIVPLLQMLCVPFIVSVMLLRTLHNGMQPAAMGGCPAARAWKL